MKIGDFSKVDVAVVGTGQAGWSALRQVRKRTDSYVLITPEPLAACRDACNGEVHKALINAAHACHQAQGRAALGPGGADDAGALGRRVLAVMRGLRDDAADAMLTALSELPGNQLIVGTARLIGPNHIMVGERLVEARSIVVAGGRSPVIPREWHSIADGVLTSHSLLDLKQLPDSVAVIGLGREGLQLACALNRLSVRLWGFDKGSSVARVADADIAAEALTVFDRAFPVVLGQDVTVARCGQGFRVSADAQSVVVEKLLLAVGHSADCADLGWHRIGARIDSRGIPLHDPKTLRVPGSSIFLAGDARGVRVDGQQAVTEGQVAGYNATHRNLRGVPDATPMSIVLSDPDIARVGVPRDAIDPAGLVEAGVRFTAGGELLAAHARHGLLKLYADKHSRALLGGEMVGPGCAHIAHLLAVFVHHGLTVEQSLQTPFHYLAVEQSLHNGLRALRRRLGRRRTTAAITRIENHRVLKRRGPAAGA